MAWLSAETNKNALNVAYKSTMGTEVFLCLIVVFTGLVLGSNCKLTVFVAVTPLVSSENVL